MANVCIRMCSSMYQLPSRVLALVLVLLQGGILDYYLIHYKDVYWYAWIAADVALGFVLFMSFVISYRHLILARKNALEKTPIQTGSLPLAYFAWLVYSSFLAAKVAIIFKDFAWMLNEDDFFGPNTLKISISFAGFIFLLLLLSHHNAGPETDRGRIITELTGTVVFDILDSVDVLDVLFHKDAIDELPQHFDTAIISIACINFILPTLPLMTLSGSHFGHKRIPNEIGILHKLLLVFFVNLPLLIIRLLLWHVLNQDISIFPVKNMVVMFLVFHELYEKRRRELEEEEQQEFDVVDNIEDASMRSSCKPTQCQHCGANTSLAE